MVNRKSSRLLILLVVAGMACAIWYGRYAWSQAQLEKGQDISYTSFMNKVNAGAIMRVRLAGDQISAVGKKGERYQLFLPAGVELSTLLVARHIDFSSGPGASSPRWLEIGIILSAAGGVLLLIRRYTGFGRSRARLVDSSRSGSCFSDVAGAEEAKSELQELLIR